MVWRVYVAACFVILSNPIGLSISRAAASAAVIGLVLHVCSRVTTLRAMKVRHGIPLSPTAMGQPAAQLLVFALWVALSITWSDDVLLSVVALGVVGAALVAGWVTAANCTATDVRVGIWTGGLASLAASFVVAVIAPRIGLVVDSRATGSLRGIYEHRNMIGFMLMLALAAGYGLDVRRTLRWPHRAAVAVVVIGLALTQSGTSLVTAGGMLVFRWALLYLKSRPPGSRWLPASIGTAVVSGGAVLVVAFLSTAVSALGRDTTLTGRTQIWAIVWDYIRASPWIGVGWGGAWDDGDGPREEIWNRLYLRIDHAHNGYLDTLLQTGVVGLTLLLGAVLIALWWSIRQFVDGSGDLWVPVVLGGLLIYNITETSLNRPFGLLIIALALGLTGSVAARRRTGEQRSVAAER